MRVGNSMIGYVARGNNFSRWVCEWKRIRVSYLGQLCYGVPPLKWGWNWGMDAVVAIYKNVDLDACILLVLLK